MERKNQKDDDMKQLFSTFDKNNQGFIEVKDFYAALELYGIPQITIKNAVSYLDSDKDDKLTADDFVKLADFETPLIANALQGKVIIPEWQAFVGDLFSIYNECLLNKSGEKATYIPQLQRVNEDQLAVAVCTIDGQVWTCGDAHVPFTIQSCSKPITYCMAERERGAAKVAKHVGHEPSGQRFNAFVLDTRLKNEVKPHNPMINAGAIMCASLLYPELEPADRFDLVLETWKRLAGGVSLGFDNATYLSELQHADRNFALAYFMKDAGAFEDIMKTSEQLRNHLEYYFQLCSITGNTEQLAVAAATLAKGGINPLTNDKIFTSDIVKNCLSLMFSCGMYDYSGEFAYSVGLPAKSGVAGCVYAVIPNLCGICVWSPRLDNQGNSARAVQFFELLNKRYAFHVFDEISVRDHDKKDPRFRKSLNAQQNTIAEMIDAAANGDLTRIKKLRNLGTDVNVADYDGRTPLHLAAAEGRVRVVQYLLQEKADINVKDRWGSTPTDEANKYRHNDVLNLLHPVKA